MSNRIDSIQRLGRTLMLPIAVLPIAGLLLRFGQEDLLNLKFMAQAGDAVFSNLPLLFAIGIAVGWAKENHGAAGLAGAVGYFVLTAGMKTLNDKINMGVLAGITAGLSAGILYNKYKDIKLPEWLAFFGGRRFIPIANGLVCLAFAGILGIVWPTIQRGIDLAGNWMIVSGGVGLFIYGVLNRLLIVTGLHHIINSLVWFVFGDFTGAKGLVHGDLNRFFAGDHAAGAFMAGFFPVMMFGLPAACLAIYRAAKPENRARVGGVLLSVGLTSFLTGITEPVEFSFMFLAPALYAIHAVLTGTSLVVMNLLGVKLGFTFSAGAIDYFLSYKLAANPLLLWPVGIGYFVVYYVVFTFAIRRWNIMTMGREDVMAQVEAGAPTSGAALPATGTRSRALDYIAALGGAANIVDLDACATRLRVNVKDNGLVREADLKALGAKGVIKPGAGSVQVVIGPAADLVSDEIRGQLKAG